MKYNDGKEVLLGDRVSSYGQKAIVVIDCDSESYADAFPREDWVNLKGGVLIKYENGELEHIESIYPEPDEL
ncbi:hypothetical protein DM558_01175 [Entomomonas moraniae]|uniref:Uncharacterized protein n=1 Tax=Entomomonas moraniae TaxID=2213226 RepID=A0A3Q9JLF8_9GAMM|nr:hypothetical protein [Entomomonas moraniae]AZS49471.1 hypothetical protein DM558_01175 [Entomomonas moraniae]